MPLLTIAIPTWNRASYLAQTLEQLRRESGHAIPGTVEFLVSDNCSPDATTEVVQKAQASGLSIRYVRNARNIGADANIAQCFNLALGRYVLILGDDDLLVDGTLSWLLDCLARRNWGVVCLRAYGFNDNFRIEYPGGTGKELEFEDGGAFLVAAGALITLISSCVINKGLLPSVDASAFCGGNLVQMHLVIQSALVAQENLLVKRYRIACKRNNSGGYDFSRVFVEELGRILDRYQSKGLTPRAIRQFETRLLVGYYPFYAFRQRLRSTGDCTTTYRRFSDRFGTRILFLYWIGPILSLPRPFALAWGAAVTLVGRVATGDLRRGAMFAWNLLRQHHYLAARRST